LPDGPFIPDDPLDDEDDLTPPKPEQIWPPPAPRSAPSPAKDEAPPHEELPVELPADAVWDDEVTKIDEAIEEIRRINGDEEHEVASAPATVEEPVTHMVAGTAPSRAEPAHVQAPRQGAGAGSSTASATNCRVRPQSENEIGQLWGNVFFSAEHDAPRAIVVTSARRGDGASQIAAALALVGAEANSELRICLVDFNLRQPTLTKQLKINGEPGLTDVLSGRVGLAQAMQKMTLKNGQSLYVMPAGVKADHPLGLIKSRQVNALLSQLREQFDHTIIDTASANSFPDAQVLGSQVDGALLVVCAGVTPRESVSEAKKRLDLAGVRCLGLVMNQRTDPIPSILYRMT